MPHDEFRPAPYSEAEILALRIRQVHLRDGGLFVFMSNGKVLRVPIAISPVLAEATPLQLYQWRLAEEGRGVVWYARGAEEHLTLRSLLAYPEARFDR